MANNKMLIDAAHPEETRVVMVRGNRVDEFDFESEHKTQLRGNIYLAKVTRVEPSLQAAFVDYGGNRHGFLAFSEIHPDYYQIPVADRQALLDAEAEDARVAAAEEAEAEAEVDAAEATREKPARKRRSRKRASKTADAENAESPEEEDQSNASEPDVEAKSSDEEEKTAKNTSQVDADDAEESDDDDTNMAAENDGDDVVSEPAAAEPPKKPRRKTSRKKAAPKTEAKADPKAEPKADSEPAKEPETSEASDEEAPKKKPRRRTSRKKPVAEEAEAEQTSQPVSSSKADAEPAAESVAEPDTEQATEDKPKKTRRRTSRSKKVEEVDAKEADAFDSETSEAVEADPETEPETKETEGKRPRSRSRSRRRKKNDTESAPAENENGEAVEDLGSEDALEEVPARRAPRRHYKIQEVIKRRQILLVQVVKEERGNKGAALTTYLSLAGRYSVLMPNTARGGGISRKITNAADRKRLKSVASGLDVPQGMGVILRTAGAARKPEEIQRDFEYLMRLWENVRTLTLESTAPCLVYEEGSLIKRSIRDLYDAQTSEILVAGEAGHREAKDFMTMLMPNHAKNVKLYQDRIPMFARMGVEAQLDAMLQPQVTLKSGGYLIIDQTEALVAIDVNSGRSTRQHSVEDTAAQTNLEAADEVARQLRLRDLAGLIVIDFIDMEDKRNIRNVEKRLKDALKNDRARIQVGRISHFGLMEMSRQRIRASVLESTTQVCPTCEGLGHVRAASSVVLAVLRAVEEHLNRNSRNDLTVKVSTPTALYLLNNKRDNLGDLESRFGVSISIATADDIGMVPCVIEKGEQSNKRPSEPAVVSPDTIVDENGSAQDITSTEGSDADDAGTKLDSQNEGSGNGEGKKRRRRRRKRKNSDAESTDQLADDTSSSEDSSSPDAAPVEAQEATETAEEKPKRRSRRSKKSVEAEQVEADVTPEEPAEEEKKPKTRRTRAKKAASTQGDDGVDKETKPDVEIAAEQETAEESPPKRRTTRRKKENSIAAESTASDLVSENAAATLESQSSDAPADGAAPKKAGWWQRKFF